MRCLLSFSLSGGCHVFLRAAVGLRVREVEDERENVSGHHSMIDSLAPGGLSISCACAVGCVHMPPCSCTSWGSGDGCRLLFSGWWEEELISRLEVLLTGGGSRRRQV